MSISGEIMAEYTILNPYEALGAQAPVPCDISEAHGVAMAVMSPGTVLTPLPFRQPELQPHEIRIRVTHCGMCHTDGSYAAMKWANIGYFPLVPGHEIVGIVDKKGEGVEGFRIGEKVGFGCYRECCQTCAECPYCSVGDDNSCPLRKTTYPPTFGGYATSFQASSAWFFHLPEEFSGLSAPLFCAGATVYEPLKLHTSPGKKVGIMGIGGLGHIGIQIASKMGCDVVAISTSDSKRGEAMELGAHSFLNTNNEAEVRANLGKLDHILVTASNFSLGKTAELLKNRGSLSVVGVPDKDYDVEMDVAKFVPGNKAIFFSAIASRANTREMIDFCLTRDIKAITELYPFAEAQRGFDSLNLGNPHFPKYRAVMEMDSFFETFTPAS
jgi:D-arabinose 1-dehydrogenase-like Zn-dependent alcohol dehydrogenase